VPHAVLVPQLAGQDVSDDLHVAVRVRAETSRGLDAIVIDHPQRAKPEAFRVVMLAERKRVAAVEPARISVESLRRRKHGDHVPPPFPQRCRVYLDAHLPSSIRWNGLRARARLSFPPWLRFSIATPEATSRGPPVRRPRWSRSWASPRTSR